ARRGGAPGDRQRQRHAGAGRQGRPGLGLRYDQLRPRAGERRRRAGGRPAGGRWGMTEPLQRPKRKDPLKKTRVPLLPQGVRSLTALWLMAASAEGLFQLQVCGECGTVVYPPRDACPRCLSSRLPFKDVADGGTLLAETTIRTSTDVYFRERMPWRIGTVK